MRHVARSLAAVLCLATGATAAQHAFLGRSLDEALRLLQQDGLPLVYSSEVVTSTMRVTSEPRATTPRQQLDELLSQHGLKAQAGPGPVILVVRDHHSRDHQSTGTPRTMQRRDGDLTTATAADSTGFADRITVLGSRAQMDRAASDTTLDRRGLQVAGSPLQSEALEAIHAMPRVTALDDYRGDFSVRGSPYRQIGIVIDGVPTRWLRHAVYGRTDPGSLSMFGSDILERATLQAGAYPRRYDDTLGAQLDLTLKEGSRDSTHFATMVGGMTASFVADGPIGHDGRGSWVVGARNSYRSWPPRRWSADDVGFAFTDSHAKLVYDVSPTQQVTMTALGGRSALDTVDEPLTGPLGSGIDRAGLVTVGWQSSFGPRTVVRHHVSVVGQQLVTTLATGQVSGHSNNRELAYRTEVLHAGFGGVLEAGAEVSWMSGARELRLTSDSQDVFRASWTTQAAYVNFARPLPGHLSFESGVRVSGTTLARERALSPWMLGTWAFKTGWALKASGGTSCQYPDLDVVLGAMSSAAFAPERATLFDVGIDRTLSRVRWQATVFTREEHDVLRPSERLPRIRFVQGDLPDPAAATGYRNALHGSARGLELVVTRDAERGVAGWISYTYARARQTDTETGETYWGDVDRRHAVNAAGLFHIGRETSLGLVLRTASGLPVPGYFTLEKGVPIAGEHRNTVRLAPYVRLDARARRTFFASHHSLTVFGEVLNALNHRNDGVTDIARAVANGNAIELSRPLLPRRVSFGVEVNFSRR